VSQSAAENEKKIRSKIKISAVEERFQISTITPPAPPSATTFINVLAPFSAIPKILLEKSPCGAVKSLYIPAPLQPWCPAGGFFGVTALATFVAVAVSPQGTKFSTLTETLCLLPTNSFAKEEAIRSLSPSLLLLMNARNAGVFVCRFTRGRRRSRTRRFVRLLK